MDKLDSFIEDVYAASDADLQRKWDSLAKEQQGLTVDQGTLLAAT